MSTPRILILILVVALLAACGKKGALYLPDKDKQVTPPPAQEEPRSK